VSVAASCISTSLHITYIISTGDRVPLIHFLFLNKLKGNSELTSLDTVSNSRLTLSC